MSNNRNKKRRTRRHHDGPNFIQLFRYLLDSPAYASLSVWARAALIEVNRAFNGSNNGRIVLSVREVATRLNCHRDTAARALQELVDRGFIEPRTKGAFSVKFRRATEWRLNDRRCNATGKPQSQAFLKWTSTSETQPPRRRQNSEHGPTEQDRTVLPRRTLQQFGNRHHGPTA
jgi:DNA-binding transcriptional MocR family regulator